MSALSRNAGTDQVCMPRHVAESVMRDLSQAHIALEALAVMLRGERQPDGHGLAYLLDYIQSGLERSDELMSPFMRGNGHVA